MVVSTRRWGGRRIHDLDDGGPWLSDEAGKRRISGVLAGVEWMAPPARRTPQGGPLTDPTLNLRGELVIVRPVTAPATGR